MRPWILRNYNNSNNICRDIKWTFVPNFLFKSDQFFWTFFFKIGQNNLQTFRVSIFEEDYFLKHFLSVAMVTNVLQYNHIYGQYGKKNIPVELLFHFVFRWAQKVYHTINAYIRSYNKWAAAASEGEPWFNCEQWYVRWACASSKSSLPAYKSGRP